MHRQNYDLETVWFLEALIRFSEISVNASMKINTTAKPEYSHTNKAAANEPSTITSEKESGDEVTLKCKNSLQKERYSAGQKRFS